MSFYKELQPYFEYIRSIRKLKEYLSFDLEFPSKWSIPKNYVDDGQTVSFDSEDPNKRGISFVTPFDELNITNTLTKIAKIIKLNKEREIKEKLFKQMIEQLKQTFEKNDLEKLYSLYFDFETDTTPKLDIDEPNATQSENTELDSE